MDEHHVFLIDVTRHMGSLQSLISSARAHMEGFAPREVRWYCHSQQTISPMDGEVIETVDGVSQSTRMQELVTRGVDGRPANSTFHILSYDAYALSRLGMLNSQNLRVVTLHLGAFGARSATATQQVQRTPPAGTGAGFLTDFEAIELAKKVLADGHHDSPQRALRQTQLRALMSSVDSRARKNLDPRSATLVRAVVANGLAQGWLGRDTINGQSGTEMIWLKGSNAAVLPAGNGPISVSREEQAEKATEDDKGHKRTQEMIQVLKRKGIYSPKDIRDFIFEAVKRLIEEEHRQLTTTQLFREAMAAAEAAAKERGIQFPFWYAAAQGVKEMMLLAGVLRDTDGNAIRPGFQSRATQVSSLQREFVGECEGLLLKEVLNGLGNVTQRDATAIAHALFKEAPDKSTRDQMSERLDDLFAKMAMVIVESDTGVLTVESAETLVRV